jgi:hypothetical protein
MKVDATIPNEGVAAILKAIGPTKGAATLAIGETFATVSSATLEISVGLLTDPYPNGAKTLIKNSESSIKSKIRVNRDELADALEACATVNEVDKIVNFTVKDDWETLEISGSNSRDTGGGISMDCKGTSALAVGVPGAEMAAVFRKLKTKEQEIEIMVTDRAMFVKQPERIAFLAMAQPKNID